MATRLVHFHFVALEVIELLPYGSLRRRKEEKTWETNRPLSASLQLHLACFMHHLGLRPWKIPLPSFLTSQGTLIFLLQTSEGFEQCLDSQLVWCWRGDSHLHLICWCKGICFERRGFIFRTQPMWYGRFRCHSLSGLGWKARDNPRFLCEISDDCSEVFFFKLKHRRSFTIQHLYIYRSATSLPNVSSLTLRAWMLQIMCRIPCRIKDR